MLAFDTSGPHCAAALWVDDTPVAQAFEPMVRGQAERLLPMVEEMLAQAGTDWHGLSRLGVGIGPGNFTGIRIGVAAARGLALGLGIPAIGVNTFDAMRLTHPDQPLAIPAGRDAVYLLAPGDTPTLIDAAAIPPGTLWLADILPPDAVAPAIARIAAARALPLSRPAPLYIREADAAPPRQPPPVIVA